MAKMMLNWVDVIRVHQKTLICFLMAVIVTAIPMVQCNLSDDQITYWYKASLILNGGADKIWWEPPSTFSYLLSVVFRWTHGVNSAFVAIYCVAAMAYLCAMYWCLALFTSNRTAAAWTAVISLVPHYTLGMTYWGFAGFEFVKARILIMPLVPVIIGLYFKWKKTDKIWIVFVICGLACALNFEAMYLGLALCVFTGVSLLTDRKELSAVRMASMLGVAAFLIIMVFMVSYRFLVMYVFGAQTTVFEYSIYERLARVFYDQLHLMSDHAYLALKWQAMSEAFWWALFPPKASDIVLFFLENLIVLIVAAAGLRLMISSRNNRVGSLMKYAGCVLLVAYGYQVFRWVAWKLLGWPPDIWEEVRAFKFVLFPAYAAIAVYVAEQMHRSRRMWTAVVLAALFISPMQVMRALPDAIKIELAGFGEKFLPEEKRAYLQKYLEIGDPAKGADIDAINEALLRRAGTHEAEPVLTTEHRVKLSGLPTMISYQDKRAGNNRMFFDDPSSRKDFIAVWHLAFSEIRAALESARPEEWLRVADKYGCRYLVVGLRASNERLMSVYEGTKLSCYEVLPTARTGSVQP